MQEGAGLRASPQAPRKCFRVRYPILTKKVTLHWIASLDDSIILNSLTFSTTHDTLLSYDGNKQKLDLQICCGAEVERLLIAAVWPPAGKAPGRKRESWFSASAERFHPRRSTVYGLHLHCLCGEISVSDEHHSVRYLTAPYTQPLLALFVEQKARGPWLF